MKTLLKAFRGSQPANYLATGLVKTAYALAGCTSSECFIKHLPRSGAVRARLPNGRMLNLYSQGDDGIANQVFWRGWTADEPEALPLFFALARRASVVFDVGAHVGLYSLVASLANPVARIFAFEPLKRTCDRLLSNLAKNSAANVEVLPCALGDVAGAATLYCAHRGIPMSSSLSREFLSRTIATPLIPETVAVTTVDDFCRSRAISKVDLIKLDIEGLEPEAVRGMSRLLDHTRPDIFCEVLYTSGTDAALSGLLAPLGYRIFALNPGATAGAGIEEQATLRVAAHRRNYLFSMRPLEELKSLLHGSL
jgi:FkbM family methyltransferase